MPNDSGHGRPSKYKSEYDQQLIDHMEQGYSFDTFAGICNVNLDTLYEWAKVHPSFSEAKKIAFNKCQLFWEKLGIDNIINLSESDKISSRSVSLNTGTWIFNMKNRFKWTDRVEIQGSGDEEKPLLLSYKK